MRRFFLYSFLICIVLFIVNCENINDFHDIYLEEGEIIYIAKVDSVDAFGGYERVLLRLYTKSPKITQFAIFWNQRIDSLIVPVENRVSPDYLDVIIENLEEKSYVFEIFSRDSKGHRSIVYEQIAEVYGEIYFSTLINHPIEYSEFYPDSASLSIDWFSSIDETEIGVEFKYNSTTTESVIYQFFEIEDLISTTQINDIDTDYPVSYRTLFLPEPEAIDTFKTAFSKIDIFSIVNVALNKPATIREGDFYAEKYGAANAVDGIVTNDSRWVSSGNGEHWIEIDLLEEYNIFGFKTLIGAGGSFHTPIPAFTFQAEIDGEWENIVEVANNTNPQYEVEFSEVTTSKVRYYVPEGVIDHVRLYEIEVYSKIKY